MNNQPTNFSNFAFVFAFKAMSYKYINTLYVERVKIALIIGINL